MYSCHLINKVYFFAQLQGMVLSAQTFVCHQQKKLLVYFSYYSMKKILLKALALHAAHQMKNVEFTRKLVRHNILPFNMY